MTILASSFLANARADLNDTGTTKRYSDREILTWANFAIKDYSKYFRVTKTVTLSVAVDGTASGTTYTLPTCLDVSTVIYNSDGLERYLVQKEQRSGDVIRTTDLRPTALRSLWRPGVRPLRTLHYDLQGLTGESDATIVLTLDFQPQSDATLIVEYRVAHTEFIPTDTTSTTDVPAEDEELLNLYALGKAFAKTGGQSAQLDRWLKEDSASGSRTDNPLIPQDRRYFSAYRQKLQTKLAHPRPMRLRRRH